MLRFQQTHCRIIHLKSLLCHTSRRPRARLLSVVEGIEELKMPNFMDVKVGGWVINAHQRGLSLGLDLLSIPAELS